MAMPRVEHVVVLMLENRSFDHLLGFLDGRTQPIDGLTGAEQVPVDPHNPALGTVPVARALPFRTDPDPGHELDDVTVQIFGSETPPAGAVGAMNGFVFRYMQRAHTIAKAAQVMECFDPRGIPALATLAREFAVCDRWFSSMPGPTWPNRFFVHCATAGGIIDNPVVAAAMNRFNMPTIYDLLTAAGRSWRIYFGDIPQSLGLASLRSSAARGNFRRFDRFAKDVADGDLPSYTFIEPRYFGLGFGPANDQHASHNVRHGEDLIGDVYEAIRRSSLWTSTLLVIVYDEHGGFYDHVMPSSTVNPDGRPLNPKFDFTRLGVRVPCVLVSPFIDRGITASAVMDHTSILATVRALFALAAPLTQRDARAQTFEGLLTLSEPRDAPLSLDRPTPEPTLREGDPLDDAAGEPLSDLQQSLVALAESLDAEIASDEPVLQSLGARTAAELDRSEAAGVYVRAVMRRIIP